MSIKINYNKNLFKKNSTNLVLFVDENFSISGLKKHLSGKEYSYIADLIKVSDKKENIIAYEISSKRKIIIVSIKKKQTYSDILSK